MGYYYQHKLGFSFHGLQRGFGNEFHFLRMKMIESLKIKLLKWLTTLLIGLKQGVIYILN